MTTGKLLEDISWFAKVHAESVIRKDKGELKLVSSMHEWLCVYVCICDILIILLVEIYVRMYVCMYRNIGVSFAHTIYAHSLILCARYVVYIQHVCIYVHYGKYMYVYIYVSMYICMYILGFRTSYARRSTGASHGSTRRN